MALVKYIRSILQIEPTGDIVRKPVPPEKTILLRDLPEGMQQAISREDFANSLRVPAKGRGGSNPEKR